MVNSQLLDYIRQQFAAGVSKEEISKALTANNWQVGDINEAFAAISNPQPVSPPATAQTSTQNPIQPISSRGHKGVWVIVVVVLVIIGAGGTFATYHYGLFTPPTASTTTASTSLTNTNIVSTTSTQTSSTSSTNQESSNASSSTTTAASFTKVTIDNSVPAIVANSIVKVVSPFGTTAVGVPAPFPTMSSGGEMFLFGVDATNNTLLAAMANSPSTVLSANSTALAYVRIALGPLPSPGPTITKVNQDIQSTAEFSNLITLIKQAWSADTSPTKSSAVETSIATVVNQVIPTIAAQIPH